MKNGVLGNYLKSPASMNNLIKDATSLNANALKRTYYLEKDKIAQIDQNVKNTSKTEILKQNELGTNNAPTVGASMK